MWFRRDLRLADLPTLTSAAKPGDAAPALYVLDDALLAPSGAPRRTFLYRCLRELDAALDGLLLVAHGDPARAVPAVAKAIAAVAVHVSDFVPTAPGATRRWRKRWAVRTGRDRSPYAVAAGARHPRRHAVSGVHAVPARLAATRLAHTRAHERAHRDVDRPGDQTWTTATNARSRCSATPPSMADRILDRSIRLSSANARGR